MKTIKFIGYLFYRYYSKGSRAGSPYFRTLCSLSLLGFMHLIHFLILFDKISIIPINHADNKLTKQIILFFVFIPIFFLMRWLFRKSDIQELKDKYDYNWDKVFSGNVWLIIYIILSVTVIGILTSLKV